MNTCPILKQMCETFTKTQTQSQANLVYATTIIDSGATQHMFNEIDAFEDLTPIKSTVSCANSETLDATHVGTVRLNDEIEPLRNVLHVSKLKHNLVSVMALNDEGNDITFNSDKDVIMSNDKRTIQLGRAIGNLYHVTLNETENENYLATKVLDDYTLWHHRLGHLNQRMLSTVTKFVNGIKCENLIPTAHQPCIGCIQGKAKRRPFGTGKNRGNNPLERIHSDLCGPMPVTSLNGARYILTFIDDATRYATVYFLENKSDTFSHFVKFKTFAEKQTGFTLKTLRSDNGGEYINEEFKEYFSKNGI